MVVVLWEQNNSKSLVGVETCIDFRLVVTKNYLDTKSQLNPIEIFQAGYFSSIFQD